MIRSIIALQKTIGRNINNINSGGCIHFAFYFSKRLRELKIPHKIAIFHYDYINTTIRRMPGFNHVMVYIPHIGYVDGETIYESKEDYFEAKGDTCYYRHIELTLKKLHAFRTKDVWNSCYVRSQNTTLSKLIEKFNVSNTERI